MTEAEAIAGIVEERLLTPGSMEVGGRTFLVSDARAHLKELPPLDGAQPKPAHIKTQPVFYSKESYIDYLNAFKRAGSVVFADLSGNSFEAIFDYHTPTGADLCVHKAVFALRYTEEWQRWSKVSGQLGSQADFARFLEENHTEVLRPSGADLLEIVKDFRAVRSINFSQALRLDNGDTEFAYTTETSGSTAKGTLVVPTMFELLLPVFYGEPPVMIRAFLRYKLDDGVLKIGYQLHRAEYVKQAAFEVIAQGISEKTELPVYSGVSCL